MIVIENCNSLSDLRQKLMDGEEVRTARDVEILTRKEVIGNLKHAIRWNDMPKKEVLEIVIKALEQEPCEDWYDVPSDEMTLGQARQAVKDLRKKLAEYFEQELCTDAINRQAAIDTIESWLSCDDYNKAERHIMRATQSMLYDLPPVNLQVKTGYCKDCKWWKDSDGVYRRGIGAESQCPINDGMVYEGNGYCYRFKPQESEK